MDFSKQIARLNSLSLSIDTDQVFNKAIIDFNKVNEWDNNLSKKDNLIKDNISTVGDSRYYGYHYNDLGCDIDQLKDNGEWNFKELKSRLNSLEGWQVNQYADQYASCVIERALLLDIKKENKTFDKAYSKLYDKTKKAYDNLSSDMFSPSLFNTALRVNKWKSVNSKADIDFISEFKQVGKKLATAMIEIEHNNIATAQNLAFNQSDIDSIFTQLDQAFYKDIARQYHNDPAIIKAYEANKTYWQVEQTYNGYYDFNLTSLKDLSDLWHTLKTDPDSISCDYGNWCDLAAGHGLNQLIDSKEIDEARSSLGYNWNYTNMKVKIAAMNIEGLSSDKVYSAMLYKTYTYTENKHDRTYLKADQIRIDRGYSLDSLFISSHDLINNNIKVVEYI